MKIIEGGVCAAKGFKAGAMRCGIRKSHTKKDLAMILSDCVCNASAVYTTNRVKASPILLTKEHLADGKAQAVIVNSGNANACAPFGMENARRQAKAGARALGVSEENVIVASTGVIGQMQFGFQHRFTARTGLTDGARTSGRPCPKPLPGHSPWSVVMPVRLGRRS